MVADKEDSTPTHLHSVGASMRLLTSAEESGYRPLVPPTDSLLAYASPSSNSASRTSHQSKDREETGRAGRKEYRPPYVEDEVVDRLRYAPIPPGYSQLFSPGCAQNKQAFAHHISLKNQLI